VDDDAVQQGECDRVVRAVVSDSGRHQERREHDRAQCDVGVAVVDVDLPARQPGGVAEGHGDRDVERTVLDAGVREHEPSAVREAFTAGGELRRTQVVELPHRAVGLDHVESEQRERIGKAGQQVDA